MTMYMICTIVLHTPLETSTFLVFSDYYPSRSLYENLFILEMRACDR